MPKVGGLTPIQRKIVESFNGSIKDAANAVGCSHQYARMLFSKRGPKDFHKAIQKKDDVSLLMAAEALATERIGRVATQKEIQVFWTELMMDEDKADGTRIDASAKLARSKGMFIERIKHEGGGKPIQVNRVDVRERINSLLGVEGEGPPEDFLE